LNFYKGDTVSTFFVTFKSTNAGRARKVSQKVIGTSRKRHDPAGKTDYIRDSGSVKIYIQKEKINENHCTKYIFDHFLSGGFGLRAK
jgi:hypothetical protein